MNFEPTWVTFRRKDYSAGDLLRHFGIDEPPVPVFQMAADSGVELYEKPNAPWEGALVSSIENGSARILVKKENHIHRQRFTVAHELGHLMLHEPGLVFRDVNLNGYNTREVQANSFAANLLMPQWMVQVLGEDVDFDAYQLSRMFKVSVEAMRYRLENLYGSRARHASKM